MVSMLNHHSHVLGCGPGAAGPVVDWQTFPLTYMKGIHESHIKNQIISLMNRLLLLRWHFV